MAKRNPAPAATDLPPPAEMVLASDEPAVEVVAAEDPAAPLEPQLSPAEQALVDQAVAFLNGAARETGLTLARTVSDYVVTTFCAGDTAVLSSHVPFRRNTIAAVSRHPNLQMGASTLRRLVPKTRNSRWDRHRQDPMRSYGDEAPRTEAAAPGHSARSARGA